MRFILFLIFCFLFSCAHLSKDKILKNSTSNYHYTDSSGDYLLERKYRYLNGELILRNLLKSMKNQEVLESTVVVSKTGSSKKIGSAVMLPKISQHKVWFSKKKYYSKISLNKENKEYELVMRSPEKKWNGTENFKTPAGKRFCWFSMLPECMGFLDMLKRDGKPRLFYTLWGSYPYHMEQINKLNEKGLFVPSYVKFDSVYKGDNRFEVNIAGQTLFYFFDKNYTFKKMFWISQGISIIKK